LLLSTAVAAAKAFVARWVVHRINDSAAGTCHSPCQLYVQNDICGALNAFAVQ